MALTAERCNELAEYMESVGCPQAAAAWRESASAYAPVDVEGDMLDEGAYERPCMGCGASITSNGYRLYCDDCLDRADDAHDVYCDEPDAVWFDLAINKAGDDGRVVNWAHA